MSKHGMSMIERLQAANAFRTLAAWEQVDVITKKGWAACVGEAKSNEVQLLSIRKLYSSVGIQMLVLSRWYSFVGAQMFVLSCWYANVSIYLLVLKSLCPAVGMQMLVIKCWYSFVGL